MNKKFLMMAFMVVLLSCLVSCVQSSFDENISSSSVNLSSINNDDSVYYWMGGVKHYLSVENSNEFVLFNSDELVNEMCFSDSGSINIALINNKSRVAPVKNKTKWGVLTNVNNFRARNSVDNNYIYNSPCYKDSNGDCHVISNLIYVKLKQSKDSLELFSLAKKYNVEIIGENPYMKNWYTLYCTNQSVGKSIDIANKLYETGTFVYAEPDVLPSKKNLMHSYNDQYYSNQWNLHNDYSINFEPASLLTKGKGVVIGVIDSGVDVNHPDLDNNIEAAYDTYNKAWFTNGIYDTHGMCCVGIIGAKTNNKLGVVGVASESKVISISVSLLTSPNIVQDLASALTIAINSSDVVSCSWGSDNSESDMIRDAIYNAYWGRQNKGTVILFSSGNSYGKVSFPANCDDDIIVVGAIDQKGKRADFSNYGRELDVVAPGVNIPTLTLQQGSNLYGYDLQFTGTSASCPQVAAVAALVMSVNPKLTSREIKSIIERTARKVGGYNYQNVSGYPNGTWNKEMGYGLVDAYAAVKEAQKTLK